MKSDTLLIELGTEELPPKTLKKLSNAFTKELVAGLLEAQLISPAAAAAAQPFATPRRLALVVPDCLAGQPDQIIERRGPAIKAAFQQDGEPTPAAQGFARSCGVSVSELARIKTEKGEWLSYSLEQAGQTVSELIAAIINQAIKRLPIAKRMRWGAGEAEFVRPVHWLIVMHGERVLPATILDIEAGNLTRGHRFHSSGDITVKHADQYQKVLRDQGHVVASFELRQSMISEQIAALAASIEGVIEPDQALLDEVTGLVEQPTAVLGSFAADFLRVPQECLISSMRDHQKYFHVVDQHGQLLPHFITVSNIQSKDPQRVKQGNERVLRARLSDAQFFWNTDQKTRLEDRVEKLDSVLFHAKLGSVLDKTLRIQALAGLVADLIGANKDLAARGALLAKADLISDMVGEFDELQGIMGHYYADRDGEPKLVGECIEQHYWPKFAGDQLPQSPEAQSVALADKLDSLIGIFASGEVPTGDKDPYGLRRAALSILRILIEYRHPLNLSELVSAGATILSDQQGDSVTQAVQDKITEFMRDRLTAFYQSQGIATSTINAVMACKPDSPLDFENRVKAVQQFGLLEEAEDLAAANKRISNILKKQHNTIAEVVDIEALVEDAEKSLYQHIQSISASCNKLFDQGKYTQGLKNLASLRTPVDQFFEHVMVMSDNPVQQTNRLALLKQLQSLFLRVADISQLQT